MALDPRAMEISSLYSQSLTQTAFFVSAGSIAALLSTSYIRPSNVFVRRSYFLFIPAWICLAASIYNGITVARCYLAWLWAKPAGIDQAMNDAAADQINWLEAGLAVFALWMFVYLFWWILAKRTKETEGS